MLRSDERILTTHAGSLPRPKRLVEMFARLARREPVDHGALRTAVEESTGRSIERQLSLSRGLDGCNIKINSQDGAVHISGTVQRELQKDFAMEVVRNVDGVKSVQSDLQRF